MKKFIIITIMLLFVFSSFNFALATDLDISKFNSSETALLEKQELAHQMAECARGLGYPEDCEIIKIAQTEWWSAQEQLDENKSRLEYWNQKFTEYPYATYIWLYLTETLGYNNYVAAGILGNIMSEVGGNTLNIRYWLYSYNSYYYGMCQWNRTYFPGVQGADLPGQCDYLANTMYSQFGNKYNTFVNLQSTQEAALMFAKNYERCAASTYRSRQNNAIQAYNYFVQ